MVFVIGPPPGPGQAQGEAEQEKGHPQDQGVNQIFDKIKIPCGSQVQPVKPVKESFKLGLCPVKDKQRDEQDNPGAKT